MIGAAPIHQKGRSLGGNMLKTSPFGNGSEGADSAGQQPGGNVSEAVKASEVISASVLAKTVHVYKPTQKEQ